MSDRERYWRQVNDDAWARTERLWKHADEVPQDMGLESCEVLPGPCYEPDDDLDEQVYPGPGGE
jgi:hypothetical protein